MWLEKNGEGTGTCLSLCYAFISKQLRIPVKELLQIIRGASKETSRKLKGLDKRPTKLIRSETFKHEELFHIASSCGATLSGKQALVLFELGKHFLSKTKLRNGGFLPTKGGNMQRKMFSPYFLHTVNKTKIKCCFKMSLL